MATCKDNCLFALLCKHNDGISEWCLSNCPLYKNKSRYIKFPCNVGDTVYFVPYGNHIFEFTVVRLATEPIEEIGFSICCNGGWVFDNRHIGETVFFTREEAEKALAERSKT